MQFFSREEETLAQGLCDSLEIYVNIFNIQKGVYTFDL